MSYIDNLKGQNWKHGSPNIVDFLCPQTTIVVFKCNTLVTRWKHLRSLILKHVILNIAVRLGLGATIVTFNCHSGYLL